MWIVLKKEIKEFLRDKKTLFFMIGMPLVLFPIIGAVAFYFTSQAISEAQNKVLTVSIINQASAPKIVDVFETSPLFDITPMDENMSAEQWVKNDNVDFVLALPDNFSDTLLDGGQMVFSVYLNDAGLNLIENRLKTIIRPFTQEQQTIAFSTLDLNTDQQLGLLTPMVINKINVADKRESVGETIGGFIPYLLFILCLQGAMIPATDLGAGEKERGTLETLLLSPIQRNQLVMGKFLAISLAGAMTAMITVFSMAFWGIVISQGMAVKVVADFMGAISILDFLLIFLMLIPVVSIFASVLLSLSVYARSFKEAQAYMTPLVFITILPIAMSLLPGVELKGGWAWVPLTNVSLAIKELIKGTMDYYQLIAIFISTVGIAGATLAFSVYWFNQEKVLFR